MVHYSLQVLAVLVAQLVLVLVVAHLDVVQALTVAVLVLALVVVDKQVPFEVDVAEQVAAVVHRPKMVVVVLIATDYLGNRM
jgi:hypothetical protein